MRKDDRALQAARLELCVPHLANDVEAPGEKGEHVLAQPVAVRLDDHQTCGSNYRQ